MNILHTHLKHWGKIQQGTLDGCSLTYAQKYVKKGEGRYVLFHLQYTYYQNMNYITLQVSSQWG